MMELEKQVVSLPLAQRLKALGVKQESAFAWCDGTLMARAVFSFFVEISASHPEMLGGGNVDGTPYCCEVDQVEEVAAAFTVAELGEMLPAAVRGFQWMHERNQGDWPTGWKEAHRVGYVEHGHEDYEYRFEASGDTEAEARGALLCALIEAAAVKP